MTASEPQLEGYTVEGFIGSGGAADVWRLTAPGGAQLAAKVFREADEASGRTEWRSMRRHSGAHVMPVIDLLRDDAGRSVLLMPYQAGGSLYDIVVGRGGLTAGECVTALAPIAGALSRIHDGGCVHGDVTPKNILFDEQGRPVLSDLGASRVAALPGEAEWGSAGYVAPEVLEGHAPAASSDVYSIAAVAWFALVGEAPAPASLRPHLRDLVPDVPEPLERLITACLSITPTARPYSNDVAHRLLDAARPVAVPLDRAESPEAGKPANATDSITRRLREEAQRHQLLDDEIGDGSRARRESRRVSGGRRATNGSRTITGTTLIGAAASFGLVLLVGSFLWPTSSETASVASAKAVSAPTGGTPYAARASSPKSAPAPTNATAAASGPTQADVERLLGCRAAAWNRVEPKALQGCLAPNSTARSNDEAALTQARAGHVTYSGVGYRITKFDVVEAPKQGQTLATATVVRTGYTVTQGSHRTTMPSVSTPVELRLLKSAGEWKISEWRGR